MEEILKMPTADELEVECPMCYGEGRFEVVGGEANWDLMDPVNWSTCSECNGEGKILRKGV